MPSSYAIGEHFEKFIRAKVGEGRYASASEVVREGLRLLEEQERLRQLQLEDLRRLIDEGAKSGSGIPAAEVFAELRQRIAEISAKADR